MPTASLTVVNAQNTANYYCLVTGQNGPAIAGPVKITVNPNCRARLSAEASEAALSVRVLGNPVHDSTLSVAVRDAEGQPLQLQLTDISGRLVSEWHLDPAGQVEQQTLNVSHLAPGVLLLRVSTPTQSQTVKVIKLQPCH